MVTVKGFLTANLANLSATSFPVLLKFHEIIETRLLSTVAVQYIIYQVLINQRARQLLMILQAHVSFSSLVFFLFSKTNHSLYISACLQSIDSCTNNKYQHSRCITGPQYSFPSHQHFRVFPYLSQHLPLPFSLVFIFHTSVQSILLSLSFLILSIAPMPFTPLHHFITTFAIKVEINSLSDSFLLVRSCCQLNLLQILFS